MHTESPTRSSVSRLTAAALFAALAYLGAAPAVAQTTTPSLTIAKYGGTIHGGRLATFTIVLTNPAPKGTAPLSDVVMQDYLPGTALINWAIASQTTVGTCGIEGSFGDQQMLNCDIGNMAPGAAFTVVVTGVSPDTCLKLDNTATAYYRDSPVSLTQHQVESTARVTITSETCLPAFVIGDKQAHDLGLAVNFWGDDWWKNNSMTGTVDNGVAAFKGWASNADTVCGAQWATRPGNSSNPPDTIPMDKDIMVIVTDTVLKDGSDITGNIKKILFVRWNGLSYGPSPGHPGNGQVMSVLCAPAP